MSNTDGNDPVERKTDLAGVMSLRERRWEPVHSGGADLDEHRPFVCQNTQRHSTQVWWGKVCARSLMIVSVI